MPDLDVFERAVDRATESATLAAELGRSVAEIADALAQAFRRLANRCLTCPALGGLERALVRFHDGLASKGAWRDDERAAALWLRLFGEIEEVERRWYDRPCTRVASLAAQRVAVDVERAVARAGRIDIRNELRQRYVAALADNVWLARVAHRLGRRAVAWADELLGALGDRVAAIVDGWFAPAEVSRSTSSLSLVAGGER
jgi:hypothetical protein